VFFALSSSQRERLLALNTDSERQEYIEAQWDTTYLLETDKAWDAIHRCLMDGRLSMTRSKNPLGKLILGGTQLYSDTQKNIVNLIEHGELSELSTALKAVTKEWMTGRYEQLRNTDYPQECLSEQDWQYIWDWFSDIPEFIARADKEGRSVIFTVDQ
jgi:hypothetical protein